MTASNRARRVALLSVTAVVAAPGAALALPAVVGGTISAPAQAAVGQKITVHADGVKPIHVARGVKFDSGYSLVLDGGTPPHKNSYCIQVLATSHQLSRTHLTYTVRIPRTIKCYSGYPASSAGSTHVTPGSYLLQVQEGGISAEGNYSFIKKPITITR